MYSALTPGAHSHESNMDSDLLTPPAALSSSCFTQSTSMVSVFPPTSLHAAYSLHMAAAKCGSLGRVNPSNSHLLDPLVDFTDEDLAKSHSAGGASGQLATVSQCSGS